MELLLLLNPLSVVYKALASIFSQTEKSPRLRVIREQLFEDSPLETLQAWERLQGISWNISPGRGKSLCKGRKRTAPNVPGSHMDTSTEDAVSQGSQMAHPSCGQDAAVSCCGGLWEQVCMARKLTNRDVKAPGTQGPTSASLPSTVRCQTPRVAFVTEHIPQPHWSSAVAHTTTTASSSHHGRLLTHPQTEEALGPSSVPSLFWIHVPSKTHQEVLPGRTVN
uniref:Uncharacterized protein n=1 Tax=Mus musculus TaxID=10090 RepID=Q8CD33_MOUSE|nr:unnamed protein product [Mus musculus]